jgi:hypothetical protein
LLSSSEEEGGTPTMPDTKSLGTNEFDFAFGGLVLVGDEGVGGVGVEVLGRGGTG